jgi:HEPN domain-containing protein
MKKVDPVVEKWLEHAKYDLATAKAMFKTGRYLYVAFMCQQTIEKVLKTIIVKNGKEVLPIHNLVRLAEISGIYPLLPEDYQIFLAELSPYAIKARYGVYKKHLSEITNKRKARMMLEQTKEVYRWLKKIILR